MCLNDSRCNLSLATLRASQQVQDALHIQHTIFRPFWLSHVMLASARAIACKLEAEQNFNKSSMQLQIPAGWKRLRY